MNKNLLIRETALQTIEIESNTITNLKSSINESFESIVNHIFNSKGRVVITGIGKSAIVAQKIVATLNSTGTPSHFMHASDAIHGDLGMIQTNDTVICFSKSGETSEIKVLVPLIRNLGNVLVGMTSNLQSFLAQQANFTLHTPISKEADPNNLAPTASTTAQMVMGDALATSLLALRGFTPKDFAQFHPGGALGKQLFLRVRDIYFQNEQPKVYLKTNVHEAILEMTSKRLGCAVVLNEKEEVCGIITDGDLRRMLESYQNKDISQLKAAEIMTLHPKTVDQNTLAVKAFEIMRNHSITQVIVTENKRYQGIIHIHDLIKEGFI
ncbi:KpsF/GutQ family sugar-phosphate isomerase [Saprospiraceae bacterium]|nr:KpsF/GutQ family sugar-phosphate isomerase [Bacteroidota bacterium]MDB4727506.1 KpsF/GutQ family sugar-phosphate isomerase [Saprospiraceae bacterium]MDF1866987.1 KpsF/GutQ family sugar-phosphate isomerase [Saprospiraceae bacterium]